MRPCGHNYHVTFGYNKKYPEELAHLTKDGRHHGVDFGTPLGTPILASVDGVLNYKGWLRGFGNTVIIKFWTGSLFNRQTYRVILAHLESITTEKKVGAKIRKFEIVGFSGATGAQYWDPAKKIVRPFFHLHAEVQQLKDKQWEHVNPKFVFGVA